MFQNGINKEPECQHQTHRSQAHQDLANEGLAADYQAHNCQALKGQARVRLAHEGQAIYLNFQGLSLSFKVSTLNVWFRMYLSS